MIRSRRPFTNGTRLEISVYDVVRVYTIRSGQTSGKASAWVHYCCFPVSRLDERTPPAFRAVRYSSLMLNAEIGLIHATCTVDVRSRALHLILPQIHLKPWVHRHEQIPFKEQIIYITSNTSNLLCIKV